MNYQSVPSESFKYHIRSPETNKEWDDYYFLRWKILRSEFSNDIDSAKDNIEDDSYHIAVFDNNSKIIGVGRLHHVDEDNSQVRYMAVEPNSRGYRIGSKILLKLIENAKGNNRKYVILHARDNALNFYKNNGFELIEKTHLLFGKIQHYLMKISL
jgi:N-acetylglutamate synthase-like GNAT family acetyltransferase